jgi:CheY-like chemotaxis protein/two-component sensor histidine kinase
MSHELRTPLNNLLILARMLSENAEKNLTPKQVKFAETIHTSGTDLLALISDILDLSKIESGKMDVEVGGVKFTDLQEYCSKTFHHVADGKGLDFRIEVGASLADEVMHTDAKRLQQVLKNLLSNALKFTEHGSVRLTIDRAESGWTSSHSTLSRAKSVIAFSVADTGIGIQTDKQKIIFEAFQQADGTTSRKYGGTGLGLSISRELARLLGGEIRLQSAPGVGSTFTLYLPQAYVTPAQPTRSEALASTPMLLEQVSDIDGDLMIPSALDESLEAEDLTADFVLEDDRNDIDPGDRVLLIVEDDVTFARILVDLAHEHGLKAVVALRGSSVISLAREFRPGAITLDITLPDTAGWTILDRLKHDAATRHIPVHVISGDENRRLGLALGAMTYLEKCAANDSLAETFRTIEESTQKRERRVLLISPEEEREAILRVLGGADLSVLSASTGAQGIALAREYPLDGLVIHMDVADINPFSIIAEIHELNPGRVPPAAIFCTRPLTPEEDAEWNRLSRSGAVQTANSLDRLLDHSVTLFHRTESDLSDAQRYMLTQLRQSDPELAGKTVLVVDDDVRNIFALTSLLEDHHLNVLHAENGRAGIDLLKNTPKIDLVLMDIMMPEMDGYETMKAIRQEVQFRALPIVALTAKAMKGDRGKCISAGASDYITKPVDLEQLFSVLRVWIGRAHENAQTAVLSS